MAGIPAHDDLQKSINDFTRAYERWQRAATAHSALMRIQGGELPPPTIELVVPGEGGAPMQIAIDLGRMTKEQVVSILDPMLDSLYQEYKQSLLEVGTAATASHRLLEVMERSRRMAMEREPGNQGGFGSRPGGPGYAPPIP